MRKRHERLTAAALADLLSRDLPRMRLIDLQIADVADASRLLEIANNYLSHFVAASIGRGARPCVCCGVTLTGVFGSFVFGLGSGEGCCSKCGYPARAVHRIDGLGTFALSGSILQYHPTEIDASALPQA